MSSYGMTIARSSMCRWVQELTTSTDPLLSLIKNEILQSHFIRGDETPVKQQERG